MQPSNIKKANMLCTQLDQIKSHQREFNATMTDNLPEDQFNEQQVYAARLSKVIKILEKQIAEL